MESLIVRIPLDERQLAILIGARQYAVQCHAETNHLYNGLPYSVHLNMVYEAAERHIHVIAEELRPYVLAATWTHDVIEDCRQTYNDVKDACGTEIADITYALTNEKGKNRKERANSKYYEGIRATPGAVYIKLCDRIANATYAARYNTRMLNMYRNENEGFIAALNPPTEYQPLLADLTGVLDAVGHL